ncbi:MAG: sulfotransferase domain-containing protein [Pseudomonadota bacterium]
MQSNLQRIIWLASYPKSGNTWMRYLLANYFMPKDRALTINQMSQFTTSDSRQDLYDKVAGRRWDGGDFDDWVRIRRPLCRYIAARRDGTHFVKTHCQIQRVADHDIIPPEVTAAAVYVIRNPFDVAPSFARHMDVDVDTAIEKMLDPVAVNTTGTGIFDTLGRWDAHVESWTGAPGLPLYLIRYEDMHKDTEAAITGLMNFLQVPVGQGKLRRAIRAASFSQMRKQEEQKGFAEKPKDMDRFFHSGITGGWREKLTPSQIREIREAFLPALQKYYPDMLDETAAAAA